MKRALSDDGGENIIIMRGVVDDVEKTAAAYFVFLNDNERVVNRYTISTI
jgi:hypothetical protein